jgi:hypothetical protein
MLGTNLEHEIVYFQILLFDHVLEQLLVHRVLLQGLLHLIIQLPDFPREIRIFTVTATTTFAFFVLYN